MSSDFMWGEMSPEANYKPGLWGPNVGTTMNIEDDIRRLQTAPSVADAQLARGLSAAQGQAQAAANSQRGVAPALAARIGAGAAGQMGLQAAQIGAALRAQEEAQRNEAIARYRGMQLQQDEQGRLAQAMRDQIMAQQEIANTQRQRSGGFGNALLDFGAAVTPSFFSKSPRSSGGGATWQGWGSADYADIGPGMPDFYGDK